MKKKYIVALDLGGTNTKVALVKGEKIIKSVNIPTRDYRRKEVLLNAIIASINKLLRDTRLQKQQILGIGIGTAGLVDSRKGIIYNLVNISGWRNVRIKKIFQQRLNISTFVDNDVNVMALAELKFGAGRGLKNILCITVGTGVGGGVIIDGKLYRGSSLCAGEVGHTPISIKGLRCNCGGIGCVETFTGNSYVVNRVKNTLKSKKKKSLILKLANGKLSNITPELLTKAATLGDKLAIDTWKETGQFLGIGLVGVVNLLNPEAIVIGGGMAGAGKFLFNPVRKTIHKRAMDLPAKSVKILKAKLGNKAGLIGAAELVRMEDAR